jgi:hypothetical protein
MAHRRLINIDVKTKSPFSLSFLQNGSCYKNIKKGLLRKYDNQLASLPLLSGHKETWTKTAAWGWTRSKWLAVWLVEPAEKKRMNT